MKRTFIIIASMVLSLFAFTSCNKDELEISKENVLGLWAEDYSGYPYFATEGYATYTFKADGKVDIHFYDAFAGESDTHGTYTVAEDSGDGKDVLALYIEKSDYSDEYSEYYKIVKLTKNVMEWQRVGTTFSKGTVGSDFKHFVRRQ